METFLQIVFASLAVLVVGRLLIGYHYRRKERHTNRLIDALKGDQYGP